VIVEGIGDDIRCVACGKENLIPRVEGKEAFQCTNCDSVYEHVWGVPFLGQFEHEDILGLIEISANISNRDNFGVNPQIVEEWDELLSAYHQADNKPSFIEQTPAARSPYFDNRYGEWQEVTFLSKDIDLQGLKVLDIGAGLGFDSHRLSMRGAHVTALEFSPILAESGQINFPHIRWIGGFSHCLPFKQASFDAVFCNAALHHMRDIPATISESLRVLRPGGILITTCDSFRPSNAGDEFELKIFDRDPAVLQGVNEGIPKFSDFVSVFEQHPDFVDVELFTHTLHSSQFEVAIKNITRWNLADDSRMLSNSSGSLALRVKLKSPWVEPAELQSAALLSAKDYASSLRSESLAMTKLAPLIPRHYVDIPFPGIRGKKFELLNGWRLQKPFHHARTAYRRGRWFLKKPGDADILNFDLKLPSLSNTLSAEIKTILNGKQVGSYQVDASEWIPASVDLSGIATDQTFAIEINMQAEGDSLDLVCFMVRNRVYGTANANVDSELKVYAIIPVFNRVHFTLQCIEYLKAQTYQNIRIIVADGGSSDGTVNTVRQKFRDVVVLTTKTELWWAGAMALGIDHALAESNGDDGFVLMMNNDTQIPDNYVASLVSASRIFDAAVGALIVDSRDPSKVLDAGEFVDWNTYSFPVNTKIEPDEQFRDDVDVLPGRGTIIPLEMIRKAGNVNAQLFPHYLSDYEFFYRLKTQGFRLGVFYGVKILAHIDETGIIPGSTQSTFRSVYNEIFCRRSMTNVVDHWRFVRIHAPQRQRLRIFLGLISRTVSLFLLRTPMRPIALPFVWGLRLARRIVLGVKAQPSQFSHFFKKAKERRASILCDPMDIPSSIRLFLYFFFSPGPLLRSECVRHELNVDELIEQGVLRPLSVKNWYMLRSLNFSMMREPKKCRRLFWSAWYPWRKSIHTYRVMKALKHDQIQQ